MDEISSHPSRNETVAFIASKVGLDSVQLYEPAYLASVEVTKEATMASIEHLMNTKWRRASLDNVEIAWCMLMAEDYTVNHKVTDKIPITVARSAWIALDRMSQLNHVNAKYYKAMVAGRSFSGYQSTMDLHESSVKAHKENYPITPQSWQMVCNQGYYYDKALMSAYLHSIGPSDELPIGTLQYPPNVGLNECENDSNLD